MQPTTALFIAFASGLLLWMAKSCISYAVIRSRLIRLIIIDIQHILKVQAETIEYLVQLARDQKFKEGNTLGDIGKYKEEGFELFASMRPNLHIYFNQRELTLLIRYYRALAEFEELTAAFFHQIDTYLGKEPLTEASAKLCIRRINRIEAMFGVNTQNKIHRLRDVPDDYRGRIAPKTMIA